jgi:serine/threonine protein kinase
MGSVYRAHDSQLERDVALKVLTLPEDGGDPGTLRREARLLAALEHPGIVPVHDVGTLADGRVYYAMKLVQGERLDIQLAANISPAERCRVFARIAEAVAFAHARGVVHCDLKPGNVMLGAFGEVLVLDWGLATTAAGDHGRRAGTPGFMAPEQVRGEPVDARTDVFALGRVLAAMALPGRAFAAVAAKASAAAAADRYDSVAALAADVARAAAGEPVTALREGPLLWLQRQYRRYRLAVWLVVSYAVLRVGFELVRLSLQSR